MKAASDTTASLLTPPGTGAIGLIRVSGPAARDVIARCVRHRGQPAPLGLDSGRLRFGEFLDNGEVIDRVVVGVTERAGRQAVDVMLHGGIRVLERAFETLTRHGATFSAAPVDISSLWPVRSRVEAEALEATQQARTVRAIRFLARQRVLLSDYLAALCNPKATSDESLRECLVALEKTAAGSIRLVHGATVAIVGPPNSGKSTLFNRLVGRPAAVVSPTAGTTRDWIDQEIEWEGAPIRLVDTAGRHETEDFLEDLAIRKGEAAVADCDLYLYVLDASRLGDDFSPLPVAGESNHICVVNKLDENAGRLEADKAAALCRTSGAVCISALTGLGVEALMRKAIGRLGFARESHSEPALFTQRQAGVCSDILSAPGVPPFETRRRIRNELWQPVDSDPTTGLE